MTGIHREAAIVDANMLNYAYKVGFVDVFGWFNRLYSKIYIHQEVLNEILEPSVKRKVVGFIDDKIWTLYDPEDEDCVSDEQKVIYDDAVSKVRRGFRNLKERKRSLGQKVKNTRNEGEIHTISAALLLGANIISSNDYEIAEVVDAEQFTVYSEELEDIVLIQQHTLEDFCVFCTQHGIASRKDMRKVFKIALADDKKLSEKLKALDRRLDD